MGRRLVTASLLRGAVSGRRGLRPLAEPSSPHVSQGTGARGVRSPWIRGARNLARGGVLERYGEHGRRAQRSRHGLITPRSRFLVKHAGWRGRSNLLGLRIRETSTPVHPT
jgi:hypothetical protein